MWSFRHRASRSAVRSPIGPGRVPVRNGRLPRSCALDGAYGHTGRSSSVGPATAPRPRGRGPGPAGRVRADLRGEARSSCSCRSDPHGSPGCSRFRCIANCGRIAHGWMVGSSAATVIAPLRQPPLWDDRGSASVTHRIEEMCRCPFTNEFATSSAMSATDHLSGTRLQARRLLVPHVPPMSRLARPQLQ